MSITSFFSLLVFHERPLYSFSYDPYEKKNCSNCADLLKSACRKSPPSFQMHVLKSATGQLLTCACRNSPPPVCRFSKIFQDSYLHVLAEIPPPGLQIFLKSATHCRFTEIFMQKLPPFFLMHERHCR